jgi:hypothetical protein
MTATLVLNADLRNYSNALGAAERLSTGNYSFTVGQYGQTFEVLPDGTPAYVLQTSISLYRSFRVRTLYAGVNDHVHDGGGPPQPAAHHGVDGLWAALGAVQPDSPNPLVAWTTPLATTLRAWLELFPVDEGDRVRYLGLAGQENRRLALPAAAQNLLHCSESACFSELGTEDLAAAW